MKNIKQILNIAVLSVTILLIAGCSTPTSIRKHKTFDNESYKDIKTIGVLPVQTIVTEITTDASGGRVPEKEKTLGALAQQNIIYWLNQHRFESKLLDDKLLSGDNNYKINQFSEKVLSSLKELYPRLIMGEDEAFSMEVSLGNTANEIADLYDTDYLFISHLNWYTLSQDKMTQEQSKAIALAVITTLLGAPMISSPHQEYGNIQGVLVDGNTGDILWAHVGVGSSDVINAITRFRDAKIYPIEITGLDNFDFDTLDSIPEKDNDTNISMSPDTTEETADGKAKLAKKCHKKYKNAADKQTGQNDALYIKCKIANIF